MKFDYQARTPTGEIQTGTVEASTREAALEILARYNLIVTGIESKEEVPIYAQRFRPFQKVSKKEVALFAKQLSVMFAVGVPIVESLMALASQTKNFLFQSKLTEIANDVDAGTQFSQALARHQKIFSYFFVSLVHSGEETGNLSESLNYLAQHLEREYILTSKIKNAMLYPAFIILVFLAVGIVMITWVFPKLISILLETGQELPLITKILYGSGIFLKKWILLLLPLSGLAIGLLLRFLKGPDGKKISDRIILKIPIIGGIIQKFFLARFAESLSTTISAGLPIVDCLDITAEVVGNSLYQKIILETKEAVKKGSSINAVLAVYPQIPLMVTQMVATGEKTGKLDSVLLGLSDFYRKEIDSMVENLMTLIEPILIVIIGIGVGILVASVLLPMYNMIGGIK